MTWWPIRFSELVVEILRRREWELYGSPPFDCVCLEDFGSLLLSERLRLFPAHFKADLCPISHQTLVRKIKKMYLPSSTQGSFCKFIFAFEIVFGFPPSEWTAWCDFEPSGDWGANEERGIGRTTFGAPRGRKFLRCKFWVDFLNNFRRLVLKMTFRTFHGCIFFIAEFEFVDVWDTHLPTKTVSSSWQLQKFWGWEESVEAGWVFHNQWLGPPKTQLPTFDFWGDSLCWGGSWRPGFLWAWWIYS